MVTRSALPQNYIYKNASATPFETFQTTSGWVIDSTSCVLAQNTSEIRYGTASLKCTPTAAGSSGIFQKAISADLAARKTIVLWFYVHGDPADVAYVTIIFSSVNNWSKQFSRSSTAETPLRAGWNCWIIDDENWTNTGSESWANPMIRLRLVVRGATGKIPSVSFGELTVDRQWLPKCVISFDDAQESQYTIAYPYMLARGIPGTCYITSHYIDAGLGATFGGNPCLTLANLQTMYAAGWAVSNHTEHHTQLSGLSVEQAQGYIEDEEGWLAANGFSRSAGHIAYPGGLYDANTLTAMANAGMKTGRGTRVATFHPSTTFLLRYPATSLEPLYEIPAGFSLGTGTTLAAAIAAIDLAIKQGRSIFIYGHNIAASPSAATDWSTADFQALIDHLYNMRSRIDCVTIDEWYNGLTNPRYRSLPLGR